ncbi:hypothetical protein FEM48_Zijuj10G0114800 [Ziziphus jujuba var. spinosa]|uniref:Small nuclear ribonucleoprotein Sm D2 n=1 Tax=Ziziphus jujuba var. spinosa TaxID=714518 RepID=A0A978UN43_ZIZJJ|nr:hypothetical protein FEM48_Zijuj10G0114800 [Ziziphus jujuba var. spinosa]
MGLTRETDIRGGNEPDRDNPVFPCPSAIPILLLYFVMPISFQTVRLGLVRMGPNDHVCLYRVLFVFMLQGGKSEDLEFNAGPLVLDDECQKQHGGNALLSCHKHGGNALLSCHKFVLSLLVPQTGKDKKKARPVTKDRLINKMFPRGDSVIIVVRNPFEIDIIAVKPFFLQLTILPVS